MASVVFLDHVSFFHGSPSVLKVDIGSVLKRVICSDFIPVALSKFFNSFY